jgi:short-subunit dehydrogenase
VQPKQTALITGASAGIGRDLAKEFAAHGYDLVLTARREAALTALAGELRAAHGTKSEIIASDLSQPSAPHAIFEFTSNHQLTIDVLVNNAGFGANGAFADIDLKTHMEMLAVNISSLVELSRLYLPSMLKNKRGGVLNVASTAAFVPGPFMTVYYATKAFVLSFSEGLANEVAGTGVTISCLCPGATTTEFQERAKLDQSRLFAGPHIMSSADVARQGYAGFAAGKTVVITGSFNKAAVLSARLLPRSLAANVARRLQEPTSQNH